ncbi:MAG: NFACT family protein [Synergistaceae bacterium]|jgi:predicted ribosome quality control (RQC) complex YloA/Tae2 family protein|nr:NFACT family protein [Synergistaceae bacterium]
MSFGPEYIHGLQAALNEKLPWRVLKVEGGESWVALRVSALRVSGEGDGWFLLSWGRGSTGCCLADSASVEALKRGASARTHLAETLKSRLVKGQITTARQLGHDRLLELEAVRFVAAGFSVRYFLVLEATEPTGNLILLDGERRIEELARHAPPDVNPYRTLLPGRLYIPPPAFQGPLPIEVEALTFEDVPRLRGVGRPLVRMIGDHWAERPPSRWLEALRLLYGDDDLPCMHTSKGYHTRFPFSFPEAERDEGGALLAARGGVLSPLLARTRARLLHGLNARVERAVKSKERHLDGLRNQLKNNAEAELFRRKGELLLTHLMEAPPWADKITLREWEGGKLLEIALDSKLSPVQNAQRYFKKYKKARADPRKIQEEASALERAIEELREQRDLLDSIKDLAQLEEAVKDVADWLAPQTESGRKGGSGKRASNTLPPHLRFQFEGYTVLVGLSARGNRYVTFRQATGDDLWLHAHEVPGAHVIIKGAKGRKELEGAPILTFAATLAAEYSKARGSLFVQVDYTERRCVRPVPGAVALVTYTNPGVIRVQGSLGA